MAYRLPSHLHRNRYGTLYFRLAVPLDLRPIVGKAEIYRSLHTASVRQAANSAQTLRIALQRLFDELRVYGGEHLSEDAQKALRTLLDSRKREAHLMEQRDALAEQLSALQSELLRRDGERLREMHALQAHARTAAIAAHGLGHRQAVDALSHATHHTAKAPAGPLLSEVIEAFIAEKKARDRWEPKTEEAKRHGFRLFSQFMTERLGHEPRTNEIDRSACVAFLELLKKLPPNITKKHADRPLSEIAALDLKPQSPRSINKYVGYVSGLFAWAKEIPTYDIKGNPAYQLSVAEDNKDKKRAFSDDELISFFSHRHFKERHFFHSYYYWLIPMALHTGARLGELCQLRVADFIVDEGVHCINITDEEDEQRLKNKNAKRLVPIHSFLIEMGLIRYVDTLKFDRQDLLFPEINFAHGNSHEASKWFNDKGRFSDSCGVTDPNTNFHSFRRTFITRATDQKGGGAHLFDVAPLVGHETGLITGDVYRTVSTEERKITVEKFQLPPEIKSLIPRVDHVTVGQRPSRKKRGDSA
ncbi:site-specific integrase [Burkholderia diffusa]|uniref:site-specific integrase n=1 Tax=Burkholderia diffusa TaxID=488732 RepID=UPI00075A4F31|nr:site-specific integrase [Burkholderia diffusa]KVH47351.1 hypothetical protein WJ39_15680 [Burkholderia diffusa]